MEIKLLWCYKIQETQIRVFFFFSFRQRSLSHRLCSEEASSAALMVLALAAGIEPSHKGCLSCTFSFFNQHFKECGGEMGCRIWTSTSFYYSSILNISITISLTLNNRIVSALKQQHIGRSLLIIIQFSDSGSVSAADCVYMKQSVDKQHILTHFTAE